MARATSTSNPVTTSVTQPPSLNLMTLSEIRMKKQMTKPMPLIEIFFFHACKVERCCHQWRTMPNWERVKVMKTLME